MDNFVVSPKFNTKMQELNIDELISSQNLNQSQLTTNQFGNSMKQYKNFLDKFKQSQPLIINDNSFSTNNQNQSSSYNYMGKDLDKSDNTIQKSLNNKQILNPFQINDEKQQDLCFNQYLNQLKQRQNDEKSQFQSMISHLNDSRVKNQFQLGDTFQKQKQSDINSNQENELIQSIAQSDQMINKKLEKIKELENNSDQKFIYSYMSQKNDSKKSQFLDDNFQYHDKDYDELFENQNNFAIKFGQQSEDQNNLNALEQNDFIDIQNMRFQNSNFDQSEKLSNNNQNNFDQSNFSQNYQSSYNNYHQNDELQKIKKPNFQIKTELETFGARKETFMNILTDDYTKQFIKECYHQNNLTATDLLPFELFFESLFNHSYIQNNMQKISEPAFQKLRDYLSQVLQIKNSDFLSITALQNFSKEQGMFDSVINIYLQIQNECDENQKNCINQQIYDEILAVKQILDQKNLELNKRTALVKKLEQDMNKKQENFNQLLQENVKNNIMIFEKIFKDKMNDLVKKHQFVEKNLKSKLKLVSDKAKLIKEKQENSGSQFEKLKSKQLQSDKNTEVLKQKCVMLEKQLENEKKINLNQKTKIDKLQQKLNSIETISKKDQKIVEKNIDDNIKNQIKDTIQQDVQKQIDLSMTISQKDQKQQQNNLCQLNILNQLMNQDIIDFLYQYHNNDYFSLLLKSLIDVIEQLFTKYQDEFNNNIILEVLFVSVYKLYPLSQNDSPYYKISDIEYLNNQLTNYMNEFQAQSISCNMMTIALLILMISDNIDNLNLSLYVIHLSITTVDHYKQILMIKSFIQLLFSKPKQIFIDHQLLNQTLDIFLSLASTGGHYKFFIEQISEPSRLNILLEIFNCFIQDNDICEKLAIIIQRITYHNNVKGFVDESFCKVIQNKLLDLEIENKNEFLYNNLKSILNNIK